MTEPLRMKCQLFRRFAGHPLAEAAGPAGDALLLAALDRQAVWLNISGDHRSGADDRAVADVHGRHERGVGADKSPVADYRPVLAEPVIIAGDRPGADVRIGTHGRIADVR